MREETIRINCHAWHKTMLILEKIDSKTYQGLIRMTSVPCCLDGMWFNCSTTDFKKSQFWIFYQKREDIIFASTIYFK